MPQRHDQENKPFEDMALPPPVTWPPVLVDNVRLERGDGFIDVLCDVTLKDSWRAPAYRPPHNYNAAWLFIRYRGTTVVNALDPSALRAHLTEEHGFAEAAVEEAMLGIQQAAARRAAAAAAGAPPRRPEAPQDDGEGIGFDSLLNFGTGEDEEAEPAEDQLPDTFRMLVEQGDTIGTNADRVQKELELVLGQAVNGQPTYDLAVTRDWRAARLSPRSADHSPGDPLRAELKASADGMGVFLQRSPTNLGRGEQTFSNLRLRWEGADEVDFPVEVWVHGIEMVYVPEGAFELGDPAGKDGPTKAFYSLDATDPSKSAYPVTSDGAIPVARYDQGDQPAPGGKPRLTWYVKDSDRDMKVSETRHSWADIPATYPSGYGAFYCMRRQVMQGEYSSFMNSLRGDQITARFPYGGQGYYRFTIHRLPGGSRATTRPLRACNWLSWTDGTAWAWWAGLRPMTELEYEKACRGPAAAVKDEYAWGTTELAKAYVILGDEAGPTMVTGNCHINNAEIELQGGDGGLGPVAEDAFTPMDDPINEVVYPSSRRKFRALGSGRGAEIVRARRSYREQTGASYWGILGLSGNLWEYVVTAANDKGRSFRDDYGDGLLNHVGMPAYAESSWPDNNGLGVCYRGGSWYTHAALARVSDRIFGAGFEDLTVRSHDTGMRCVRAAPTHEDGDR